MAQRFRQMKLRHQLFANWVHYCRTNRKIKAKALRLVNKGQQDERQVSCESDFEDCQSRQSGITLKE